MADENITKIDNPEQTGDNLQQIGNDETAKDAAGVSAPEDTATNWQEIISVKDDIISAYESQVSSLKEQIATLVRNGAFVSEENNQAQGAQTQNVGNQLGGFGHPASEMDSFSVADLGKEIGKRD